jgi:hypothetical protein
MTYANTALLNNYVKNIGDDGGVIVDCVKNSQSGGN